MDGGGRDKELEQWAEAKLGLDHEQVARMSMVEIIRKLKQIGCSYEKKEKTKEKESKDKESKSQLSSLPGIRRTEDITTYSSNRSLVSENTFAAAQDKLSEYETAKHQYGQLLLIKQHMLQDSDWDDSDIDTVAKNVERLAQSVSRAEVGAQQQVREMEEQHNRWLQKVNKIISRGLLDAEAIASLQANQQLRTNRLQEIITTFSCATQKDK